MLHVSGPSPVVKYWLVLYNLLSTLGWGYILVQTVVHLLDLDGSATAVATNSQSAGTLSQLIKSLPFVKSSPYLKAALGLEKHLPAALVPLYRRAATTYARVGVVTTAVQTCALLEVVHAALGWVRSPIQTTAMQVASRLMLVWGITEQFPEVCVLFVALSPYLWTSAWAVSHEPPLRVHGLRLVIHRGHSLFVLRPQPVGHGIRLPHVPSLHHVLRVVSSGCRI